MGAPRGVDLGNIPHGPRVHTPADGDACLPESEPRDQVLESIPRGCANENPGVAAGVLAESGPWSAIGTSR